MPDKIDHEMLQELVINDLVLTAALSVWAKWQASSGEGLVEFIVYLRKPNGTDIELYNQQYVDGASGEGYIIQNLNVKDYMNQQGIYKLRLLCGVKSNEEKELSYGWYDNISLYATFKKKKVIFEQLDTREVSYSQAKKAFESLRDDLTIDENLETSLMAHKMLGNEQIELKELLKAKIIMGNLERIIKLTGFTAWTPTEKKQTEWATKEKKETDWETKEPKKTDWETPEKKQTDYEEIKKKKTTKWSTQ